MKKLPVKQGNMVVRRAPTRLRTAPPTLPLFTPHLWFTGLVYGVASEGFVDILLILVPVYSCNFSFIRTEILLPPAYMFSVLKP